MVHIEHGEGQKCRGVADRRKAATGWGTFTLPCDKAKARTMLRLANVRYAKGAAYLEESKSKSQSEE